MLKLIRNFNRNIHENIRENRRVFLLYTVLRVLVIVALVRAIMNGNYNGAFICLLSLGLFLVPSLLEQGFKIHIPPLLEGTIYLFIFSAEILGELNHFYAAIPQWDTILHTADGATYTVPGYLDIGLNDTMGDLFVNFIGAATFSILGYIGMRHAGRHKKASLVFDLVPSREQDTALNDNYAFAEDDGFTDGIDENGQPK